MNGEQEKLVASSQQSSSQTWGTRNGPAAITTASTVQIALVASLIGALGALLYFSVKYVNDAVKAEEVARIAEVHEQAVQRVADMERLSKEAERIVHKTEKLEDEGTPYTNRELSRIKADLLTEKAERVGVDNLSIEKHQGLEARVKTIEDRDEWFLRSRVEIQAQIARLQESQRLLEHQCLPK